MGSLLRQAGHQRQYLAGEEVFLEVGFGAAALLALQVRSDALRRAESTN